MTTVLISWVGIQYGEGEERPPFDAGVVTLMMELKPLMHHPSGTRWDGRLGEGDGGAKLLGRYRQVGGLWRGPGREDSVACRTCGSGDPPEIKMMIYQGIGQTLPRSSKEIPTEPGPCRYVWAVRSLLETISRNFPRWASRELPKHTVNIRTAGSMQESCQVKAY